MKKIFGLLLFSTLFFASSLRADIAATQTAIAAEVFATQTEVALESQTPTITPTDTPTATITTTDTPTVSPTITVSASPTNSPTPTATPTASPTASPTRTPIASLQQELSAFDGQLVTIVLTNGVQIGGYADVNIGFIKLGSVVIPNSSIARIAPAPQIP